MSRTIIYSILGLAMLLTGCNGTTDPNHGNIRYKGSSEVNKDDFDGAQESKVKLEASYPR